MKRTNILRSKWDTEKQSLHTYDGTVYPELGFKFHDFYLLLAVIGIFASLASFAEVGNILLLHHASSSAKYQTISTAPLIITALFCIADIILCIIIITRSKTYNELLLNAVTVRHILDIISIVISVIFYGISGSTLFTVIFKIVFDIFVLIYYHRRAVYFRNPMYIEKTKYSFQDKFSYIYVCPECKSPKYYAYDSELEETCPICRKKLVSLGITLDKYRPMNSLQRDKLVDKAIAKDEPQVSNNTITAEETFIPRMTVSDKPQVRSKIVSVEETFIPQKTVYEEPQKPETDYMACPVPISDAAVAR